MSVSGKTDGDRLPLAWSGGSTIRRRERVEPPAAPKSLRWFGANGGVRRRVLPIARAAFIVLLPVTAWIVPPSQQLFSSDPQPRLARYHGLGTGSGTGGGMADDSASEYARQLFQQSCASCHGSEGKGLPHQGLPLRGSKFVLERNDEQLLQFLRTGRQPTDPHSQLGLVMPARGVPPLSDAQLTRVVGLIREMQREQATAGGGPDNGSGNGSASAAREVAP